MDPRGRRGATLLFTTAGLVYLADRVTKLWAEARLVDEPIEVIPRLLTLRFATNPGGAFSILSSAPWFFAAATLTVSLLIVVTAFHRRSASQSVALGLILGGALGNLTDRAVRGPGLSGVPGREAEFRDAVTNAAVAACSVCFIPDVESPTDLQGRHTQGGVR